MKTKKVRFGVIGLGGMGTLHAQQIVEARSRDFCLGAVCDSMEDTVRKVSDELNVPYFTDYIGMYDSGLIDAVLIVTPHYWHAAMTVNAARGGIHVLCEKPLASSVSDARLMIAECKKRKVKLGAMLMQRTYPSHVKMKQMVASGVIGEIFRVQMICSTWFRTQAYYDSGAWRGTWDGEGGGVLINQAPHSLDLFQWIGMGLPKEIFAMLDTREHKIEVEDTANVLCDYGDGKIGYIYASTAEEPGRFELTISGDKGTLVLDGADLRLGKLKIPIKKHIYTSREALAGAAKQKVTWKDVKLPKKPGGHIDVTRAFAASILRNTPMVATGEEAINELEISNAAYISGHKNRTVTLPVDGAEMDRLLAKLHRERSTGKGGGLREIGKRELRKAMRG